MITGGTSPTSLTNRLVTLITDASGTVTQRTGLCEKHRPFPRAPDLPEPARFYGFQP